MTTTIDVPDALRLLREVVAEFGEDYRYPKAAPGVASCSYERNGAPSCLVAQVLARAGVSVASLARLDEGIAVESGLSQAAGDVLPVADLDGVVVTPDAANVLGEAQEKQDVGYPWGEALAAAERAVAEDFA